MSDHLADLYVVIFYELLFNLPWVVFLRNGRFVLIHNDTLHLWRLCAGEEEDEQ